MKKKLALSLVLVSLFLLIPHALGETPAPAATPDVPAAVSEAAQFVAPILTYLETIPKIGPILSFAAQLAGVIGALFTMLTVFLTGSCKTLSGIAQLANLSPLADKIQAFHDKAWKYVAYLSIFNVQKPEAPALPPKV